MDIASVIGLAIGTVCLSVVFFEVSHGHLAMFYSLEGVLMVGGGSISVLFMALPLDKIRNAVGYIKRFLFHKGHSPVETIRLITTMADRARRDGILALEEEVNKIETTFPFLAKGVKMAIDGMDANDVESTLRLEIMAMKERHKAGKKFFDLVKLYGPGWALVGTLVGQIGMFGNLEGAEVGKLGEALAIAVCATMYGTVVANAIAGPIGDKLAMRSSEEIQNYEMIVRGVMSIQAGDNPRLTFDKMAVFIPPAGREKIKMAA